MDINSKTQERSSSRRGRRSLNLAALRLADLAALPESARVEMAGRPDLTEAVTSFLLTDSSSLVRASLAAHSTVSSVVSQLLGDTEEAVWVAAAGNPCLPASDIERLSFDMLQSVELQLALAANVSASEGALMNFSSGRRLDVALAVAGRTNLSPGVAENLRRDPRWQVRLAVFNHTPELAGSSSIGKSSLAGSSDGTPDECQKSLGTVSGGVVSDEQSYPPHSRSSLQARDVAARKYLDMIARSEAGLSLLSCMKADSLPKKAALYPVIDQLATRHGVLALESGRVSAEDLCAAWTHVAKDPHNDENERLHLASLSQAPTAVADLLAFDQSWRVRLAAVDRACVAVLRDMVSSEQDQKVLAAVALSEKLTDADVAPLASKASLQVAYALAARHDTSCAYAEKMARIFSKVEKVSSRISRRDKWRKSLALALSRSHSQIARERAASSGVLGVPELNQMVKKERQKRVKKKVLKVLKKCLKSGNTPAAKAAKKVLESAAAKDRRLVLRYLKKWESLLSGPEAKENAKALVKSAFMALPAGHSFFMTRNRRLRRRMRDFFAKWPDVVDKHALLSKLDLSLA